ncbi:MAG: IPTL-CTERM sorting domain-containing protein [Burkholderiales bacterium]|jgi:T5SS/PEP-CTERM-associated repeat protein/autotransporter-associated beta strand protein|nr:IPTL-CTERM sorting domain-containing protein [Burkholderiales bacterium]
MKTIRSTHKISLSRALLCAAARGCLLAILSIATPALAVTVIDGNTTVTVPGTYPSPWDLTTLGVASDRQLHIGETSLAAGASRLEIINGGEVRNTVGVIGFGAGSNGVVLVEGANSKWTNTGSLTIGDYGAGTLDITGRGAVTSVHSLLGSRSSGNGTVNVNGAGSSWTISAGLAIGVYAGSDGALNITAGGAVSTTDNSTALGIGDSASGVVNVDGPDSILNIHGTTIIGRRSFGTLNIKNGGAVSAIASNSAWVLLGDESVGNGMATVDGSDSTWVYSGEMFVVGYRGAGSLSITNGGVVSVSSSGWGSFIGSGWADSAGIVTVDGAGPAGPSTWTNSSTLSIARVGSGSLTLSGGGLVTADTSVSVSAVSGTGVINIGAAQSDVAVSPGTLSTPTVDLGTPGSLVFNHTSANHTFSPQITGSGKVFQIAGTTTLTSNANTYSGTTSIASGTLRAGAVGAFSLYSDVTVASGGTLDLANMNQTVASLNNAGQTTMGNNAIPGVFTTLTVNGAYIANGGTVAINTMLNEGDANSLSDVLVVDSLQVGSGSTQLVIIPAGTGNQTQGDGILVIEVKNGAAVPDNTFQLAAPVIMGGYEYKLYQGGIGGSNPLNWYLRSTGGSTVVAASIPTLSPAMLVLLVFALAGITLWRRRNV